MKAYLSLPWLSAAKLKYIQFFENNIVLTFIISPHPNHSVSALCPVK